MLTSSKCQIMQSSVKQPQRIKSGAMPTDMTCQKGDFLIEALIGVLLMGIVGMGVSFMSSRVAVEQQTLATQQIISNQLRNVVERGDFASLCDKSVGHKVNSPEGAKAIEVINGCASTLPTKVDATITFASGASAIVAGTPVPMRLRVNLGSDSLPENFEVGIAP